MDMGIEYDKPIEVSEKQYRYLMNHFAGIVAGRFDGVNYFIKVWLMNYSKHITLYLSK